MGVTTLLGIVPPRFFNRRPMILQLDKDVLRLVLSFIPGRDWITMERVSKFFLQISTDDDYVFWKYLCTEHGIYWLKTNSNSFRISSRIPFEKNQR
jgi:uncharacterized protein involved in type VI secretion and phage assembly